ncbi:MAG: TerD family protein [Clostridia bacterium]|nr:TerD family protein [Clostridia bacterium]
MVNLSKGQKIALGKNVNCCYIGLSLDFNREAIKAYSSFDYDTAVFLLEANGKVSGDEDLVFYGNRRHINGSVETWGGEGDDEDDEIVILNFSTIPAYVQKIVIYATIYDAIGRKQNFCQLSNLRVRVGQDNNKNFKISEEIACYEIKGEFSDEMVIAACELTRNGSEWEFCALGIGYNDDLADLCRKYGIDV